MQARYSRQQVEEILGRALRREHGPDGITHEELLAAAAEVGLGPEEIERAAEELADDEERLRLVTVVKRRRKKGFWRRLVSSGGFIALLATLDAFVAGGPFWHWVALGLSFPLLRTGVRAFLAGERDLERAAQEEAELEHERREKARKRKDSLRREAKFRSVLERAADALLGAADRHLEGVDQDTYQDENSDARQDTGRHGARATELRSPTASEAATRVRVEGGVRSGSTEGDRSSPPAAHGGRVGRRDVDRGESDGATET